MVPQSHNMKRNTEIVLRMQQRYETEETAKGIALDYGLTLYAVYQIEHRYPHLARPNKIKRNLTYNPAARFPTVGKPRLSNSVKKERLRVA